MTKTQVVGPHEVHVRLNAHHALSLYSFSNSGGAANSIRHKWSNKLRTRQSFPEQYIHVCFIRDQYNQQSINYIEPRLCSCSAALQHMAGLSDFS